MLKGNEVTPMIKITPRTKVHCQYNSQNLNKLEKAPQMALRGDHDKSPDTGGLVGLAYSGSRTDGSISQSTVIGTIVSPLYLCVPFSPHSPHGTGVFTKGMGNVSLFISYFTCLDQYEGKRPHACSESWS